MAGLGYLLGRGQTAIVWPRAPTANHGVSINSLAWPNASGILTLLPGKVLQGLRTGHGLTFSLERAGLLLLLVRSQPFTHSVWHLAQASPLVEHARSFYRMN